MTAPSGRSRRSGHQVELADLALDEILREAAYERLLARLDTMPVIEQAKGILMAESRCSPDEAFAMLRAASQRSNVKVRDLAEEIVGRVSGVRSQPEAAEPSVAG